jgi:hypothetical protein
LAEAGGPDNSICTGSFEFRVIPNSLLMEFLGIDRLNYTSRDVSDIVSNNFDRLPERLKDELHIQPLTFYTYV